MKKLVFLLFTFFAGGAFGQSFMATQNILVVRVGDGTTPLTDAAAPVFLDEYNRLGTPQGIVVISDTFSASSPLRNLTLSGNDRTEGQLTLSNGNAVFLAGHDAAAGHPAVASDSTVRRTVAWVDVSSYVNSTTTIYQGPAYKKGAIRAAAGYNGNFWCAGTDADNHGGTYSLPFGCCPAPVRLNDTLTNTRLVNVFRDQLYVLSGTPGFPGIYSVGTGMPTTGGQTITALPGLCDAADTSISGFCCFDLNPSVPGIDVIYLADARTGADGGIYKYSLVGGTWVSNGNIPCAAGLHAITGLREGCTAQTIVATSDNGVFTVVDHGAYDQTFGGSLTQIATAGNNQQFRGVSFTPGTHADGFEAVVSAANNVSCYGDTNGSVSVYAYNYICNATYDWGDTIGLNFHYRTQLAPGTYVVTVTDETSGCVDTASVTIAEPPLLTASATGTNVTCYGGTTGAINITAAGGTPGITPPYHYYWSTGVGSHSQQANLAAGNYTITVYDDENCAAIASFTITEPEPIVITANLTNLPCIGTGWGAIDLAATGGNSGFSYSWSNGKGTEDLDSLAAGSYTITVTDSLQCTATSTFVLTNSGTLVATPAIIDLSCHGVNTGAINVTASGGTPAYAYAWSNGSSNQNQNSLAAGTYTLTLTDNGSCTVINTYTVNEPAAIMGNADVTNAACFGESNGSVDITVTGGIPPYSYSWNGIPDQEDRVNVPAGFYTIVITDAHGCFATTTALVTEPYQLNLALATVDASQPGASDGGVYVSVAGGTFPMHSYNWSNGGGLQDLMNVPAGTYCVTVSDANWCTASACAAVDVVTAIKENEIVQSFNAYCNNQSLMVQAQFSSYTPYTLEIFDLTGRLLQHKAATSNNLNLNFSTSHLASACVLICLRTPDGLVTRRVVILR